MRLLGNLLWLVLGGLLVALEYALAGLLLCLTLIGIPFGLQCFKLALLALFPFGHTVREKPPATGCLALAMNVLWLLLGGVWIALTHLAAALVCAITIIGIPFALQHLKLARLALTPFGYEIVRLP
ncbi:YccF domain-containing protein [Rhodothermus marinus]|uniref:Inner membrane component domain-containing protein n=1 Tax=Rhodothermus marinus (strain ATCC 43812 / DSM 4252 / R-10) TaxID=518766 RepID=D0ME81_RHOM4|nr:YccF domain-containing protein [Rhodothermus marinus]ACY47305.1 protein of unknown function DUF307 [Rhodothermus marinus DSM 4252]